MRLRPWSASILLPLAALIVVLPLVLHGCSCGHDFDFHLLSWMEAAAQFKTGILHPAWAFSPAWNAGEPRFVFYPPISWTLGGLLGLVLPWSAVPPVYTWLALLAAGFGMYRMARELKASTAESTLTAVVYMANPYMIFTAYERAAYAELLAAAWLPLLFAAVFRDRPTVLRVAVPMALLWLTNAPAAVMGSYAFSLLAAVRLVSFWRSSTARASAELAARLMAGATLGLGLAAFYVLPAAYERRWVQIAMALVPGMRIGDNFLFQRTGDAPHDAVLHTASEIALAMLLCTVLILCAAADQLRNLAMRNVLRPDVRTRTVRSNAVRSVAALVAAVALLLTPLSGAFWRTAPEVAFLQFPWRLTALLAVALCGLLPIVLRSIRLPPVALRPVLLGLGALALVAAISLPLANRFRQICDEEDNVAARQNAFATRAGSDPTDEYTPGDADNDSLDHENPPFWLAETADAKGPHGPPGPVPGLFTVDSTQREILVLNLRDYPAWRVQVNGVSVRGRMERADGLIAVPVAAGRSQIAISYSETADRWIGDGIAIAALVAALALLAPQRRRSRSRMIESR